MSVILILGSQRDCHAQHLLMRGAQRHLDVILFDSSDYPQHSSISWDPQSGEGVLHLAGRQLGFSDIQSAFWSSFSMHSALRGEAATHGMVVLNDSASMLRTFLEEDRIAWLNTWAVYQYHKVKPRQLRHAAQLGVRIPSTYVGNDPALAEAFLKRHPSSVFKPVYGGALCAQVEPLHTTRHHLQRVMQVSPVTLQTYIEGTNVRTYVVGEQCFSATISSTEVDYRNQTDAHIVPFELPEAIESQAIAITKAFGMGWSAIDWRLDEQGDYYFLEANPSPMFMHFEMHTGYPITEALLNWLQHPCSKVSLPDNVEQHKKVAQKQVNVECRGTRISRSGRCWRPDKPNLENRK